MWLVTIAKNLLRSLTASWSIVTDWLTSSVANALNILGDVPIVGTVLEWLLGLVSIPINGEAVSLGKLTILELILGAGLPLFLGFTLVKWLLDLIN